MNFKHVLLSFLFPLSLFAVTNNKVWRVGPSAQVPSWGALNLAAGSPAVTGALSKANQPSTISSKSTTIASQATTSLSYVAVTNASVSITSTGRAVVIGTTSGAPGVFAYRIATDQGTSDVAIFRDGAAIAEYRINCESSGSGNNATVPFLILDTPSAGAHTYDIRMKRVSSGQVSVQNLLIYAYEL